MERTSHGQHQDHLACQLLPSADVRNQLGRAFHAPLTVQFRDELEPRDDVAFGGEAIDPRVVTGLDDVSADLGVDLDVERLDRQL